jgi:hypothetical protein
MRARSPSVVAPPLAAAEGRGQLGSAAGRRARRGVSDRATTRAAGERRPFVAVTLRSVARDRPDGREPSADKTRSEPKSGAGLGFAPAVSKATPGATQRVGPAATGMLTSRPQAAARGEDSSLSGRRGAPESTPAGWPDQAGAGRIDACSAQRLPEPEGCAGRGVPGVSRRTDRGRAAAPDQAGARASNESQSSGACRGPSRAHGHAPGQRGRRLALGALEIARKDSSAGAPRSVGGGPPVRAARGGRQARPDPIGGRPIRRTCPRRSACPPGSRASRSRRGFRSW